MQALPFINCVAWSECLLVIFLWFDFLFSFTKLLTSKGLKLNLQPKYSLWSNLSWDWVRVQDDLDIECLPGLPVVLAITIMVMTMMLTMVMLQLLVAIWPFPESVWVVYKSTIVRVAYKHRNLWFWWMEVQDHGASMVGSQWGPSGLQMADLLYSLLAESREGKRANFFLFLFGL